MPGAAAFKTERRLVSLRLPRANAMSVNMASHSESVSNEICSSTDGGPRFHSTGTGDPRATVTPSASKVRRIASTPEDDAVFFNKSPQKYLIN